MLQSQFKLRIRSRKEPCRIYRHHPVLPIPIHVMVVARARLTQAADALMATDAARLLAYIARRYKARSPPSRHCKCFAGLFARAIMVASIGSSMTMASLQVDGRSYRRAEATPGQAMTLFGKVEYTRSRYRLGHHRARAHHSSRPRPFPDRGLDDAGGSRAGAVAHRQPHRPGERRGLGPAHRVRTCGRPLVDRDAAAEASRRFEADGGKITDELMAEEEIHPEAVAVLGCLDGVMLRMHAEEVCKEIGAGWREASCGVAALLDAEGNMLQRVCLGRLPETGKTSLKGQLSRQLFHWLAQRPDLKLVVIADGARDNWTFLDKLEPDVTVLDCWHAVQHLKVAADAAFGEGSPEAMAWFEKWRHILRHEPEGAFKVIDALRYLGARGWVSGSCPRARLLQEQSAPHELPAACRCRLSHWQRFCGGCQPDLGATRMKRSGQRWSPMAARAC